MKYNLKLFRLTLVTLVITMWTIGCKHDHQEAGDHSTEHDGHENHKSKTATPIAVVKPDAQTREMITLVESAVDLVNPENIKYYLNTERAQLIYDQMQSLEGPERINAEVVYAQEILNAGDTEKAIATFLGIIDRMREMNALNQKDALNFIKKNLAIAYLRKGEQDNCLVNHTSESCIIPISEVAQHQLETGSRSAIKYFLEVLDYNPEDPECRYLLNIAYMTLGEYPDKVPEAYLIDPGYFYDREHFPRFPDRAMDLGVDVKALSGGICLDDFNNDGYLDFFVSSWGFSHQIRYFENDGAGGFIDKTNNTGLEGVTGGLNLRHADYNNDGFMDFIILRGAWFFKDGKIPNSLIRNNGDGTFTDVTLEAGVYSERPTQTAVWSDFNLDGWLDLFVANESNSSVQYPCELYVSNGDGTFSEKAEEAGIIYAGFFKGIAAGDIDGDGFEDLYFSNLGGRNFLMLNRSTQDEVKFLRASDDVGLGDPYVSFPTWMFDYNNDGLLDIFVSGYSHGKKTAAHLMIEGINGEPHENRPYVYRNNGDGTFSEMSKSLGLTEPVTTMGCNFGDLDNDGYPDFYLASGEPSLYSIVPNRVYHNVGGKQFKDVTYQGGFGNIQKGHAVGFGDLDMDGDQDIYAVLGGAFEGDVYQNTLYENPMGNQNNWITILLEGTVSNRSAIGARIKLEVQEGDQTRAIYHTVGTGASFGGNSLLAEIGLGQSEKINSLTVAWPNPERTTTVFENIPVNIHVYINEGTQQMQKRAVEAIPFAVNSGGHHH